MGPDRKDGSAGVDSIEYATVTPDGRAYVYGFIRNLSSLYLIDGLH